MPCIGLLGMLMAKPSPHSSASLATDSSSSSKEPLRTLGSCMACFCNPSRTPLPAGAGHGKFGEGVVSMTAAEDDCRTVIDRLHFTGGVPDNIALAALALDICKQLAVPRHSNLRSVCLLLYREGERFCAEVGMNSEVVGLTGSCSAEQSVVAKMLLRQGGRSPIIGVEKLVLVTDAPHCVLPGYQCREILREHIDSSVSVVCAWRSDGDGRMTKIQSQTLSIEHLHPYPSPYRNMAHTELSELAGQFARKCVPVPCEPADRYRLYDATRAVASNASKAMVGACYSAGAIFFSGDIRTCSVASPVQDPSCSIEAVVRLSTWLEEHSRQDDPPQLILISDQWGVLHAPFAVGRSYLIENGYGDVSLLLHDSVTCELRELRCSDLRGCQA